MANHGAGIRVERCRSGRANCIINAAIRVSSVLLVLNRLVPWLFRSGEAREAPFSVDSTHDEIYSPV